MSSFLTILKQFWPSRIRGQLILGIALVHLILMTAFVIDLVSRQRNFLKKQNREQANSFANGYAVNSSRYIIANDFDELQRLTLSHIHYPNLKYAMILSPEGVVLAHTNFKHIGKQTVDPISRQLQGVTTARTLMENDHVLDMAVPVFVESKIIAWARVGVGQQYIQDNLVLFVRDGFIYATIAVLIATLFAIFISNTLSKGLYRLISAANKIKAGDRSIRVAPFNTLELRDLGTAFNRMLDDISANEKLLSMVIENMPVGIWIFNEKREFISGNSAGNQIWGGSKFLANNRTADYEAWHAETRNKIGPGDWASARAIEKGETTINEELEIRTIDGQHKIILNSAIPLRGKEGEIVGAIAINVDITERKKITEQLALSESTLSSAFEYSAIGMTLVSPTGKFLRVNKALSKMIGYTEEEMLSQTFQNITHPGDLEPDLELVRRTLSGEIDSYRMEKRYFHKNGNIIWVHLTVSLVRDNQNQPLFFISQIEDITERKKAERVIVQFNRLYQFTSAINEMMLHAEKKQDIFSEACNIAITHGKFSMAWMGIFSKEHVAIETFACAGDDNGYLDNLKRLVSVEDFENSAAGKAMRYKKPYYINDVATEVPLPWREEALKRGYRSLISLPIIVESGLEAVFTLYMPMAFFFNEEEVQLLQEVTNNIAYAIEKLEMKDLQKKSEEELKESEEKFRKLVEETVVGVFILQEGRFVYVNPQFENISGYSKDVLLSNMSFEQIIRQDDIEKTWKKYFSGITGERASDPYAVKVVRKDGAVLQIEIIASTISYKGKPAIIGTIIDVTEQAEEEKRINKAVTDAQENERQQISMELHDNVKQMMAASLLNIDFLKMIVKDEEATIPIISNVKNYMREAIEELRRISHQLAPSIDEKVSLEEKIKTVVHTMNVSNDIAINYHFEKFEEFITADVQLAMYRILQEQFMNIVKHAKASLVEITVVKRNGDICMSIEDNGIGFDADIKRGGLGLENIKRRVQVFNGNFTLQSSPGNGCRLDVQIPVNQN